MSEAALAAQTAADAVRNARCASSPRKAAHYAAKLRTTAHAEKVKWLFNSAINDHSTLARLLLADGLSPSTIDAGQSVLHVAASHGSIDVVRLLMEAGADANSLSNLGLTPLQAAIAHGQLACARELIPLTDLLHFSADGNNALHTSIMLKQPKIFKLLLPHFADNVDVRSIKNRAP